MNLKEAQVLKADRDYWKNLCKELSDKNSEQESEIERLKHDIKDMMTGYEDWDLPLNE